jgi:hypothetical protein
MNRKYVTALTLAALAVAISLALGLMSKNSASSIGTLNAVSAASAQNITLPNNVAIYAVNTDNVLYVLQPGSQNFNRIGNITGIGQGNVIGIDYRVSNNLLYGLTDQGQLVTINTSNATASQTSTLQTPFGGGFQSVYDFNPVADAVRIQGSNGQNYAATGSNLGTTAVQTPLAYAAGDRNAGATPSIVGGAYTNNYVGAPNTIYYAIDSNTDSFVTISSRSATGSSNTGGGQLQTIGQVVDTNNRNQPINFSSTGDFDIFTSQNLANTAILFTGGRLYTIDISQINQNLRLGQTQTVSAAGLPVRTSDTTTGFVDIAVQPIAGVRGPAANPAPTAPPAQNNNNNNGQNNNNNAQNNGNAARCSAQFVTNSFPNGFQTNVVLTNNLGTNLNGWTFTFNFGGNQRIANIFNSTLNSQSGQSVRITNASFNANFPNGSSINLGFGGTLNTAVGTPTGATLNGVPCSVSSR